MCEIESKPDQLMRFPERKQPCKHRAAATTIETASTGIANQFTHSKKCAERREKPSSTIEFSERWITLKRLRSAVR